MAKPTEEWTDEERQLVEWLADMNEDDALPLANRMLLEDKVSPMHVLDLCRAAMDIVGKRFEEGEIESVGHRICGVAHAPTFDEQREAGAGQRDKDRHNRHGHHQFDSGKTTLLGHGGLDQSGTGNGHIVES